jgi:hypothetical protein
MFSHILQNNWKTEKKSVYYNNFPVTIFKLNHLTKLAEGKHRIWATKKLKIASQS